jgi:ABC-2 type transport system ATP-binding protein
MGTVTLSRGLFGRSPNPELIKSILENLSLWDKRASPIRELSGGMKRRVLIAKALSHEPKILFLDEPTAGVDVDLRRDMWRLIKNLKASGVTVVLTTHYIEEAEEIADRIAVIDKGRILLVEEKTVLMERLGKKQLSIDLDKPLSGLPTTLMDLGITLENNGRKLIYNYNVDLSDSKISEILLAIRSEQIQINDVHTEQSSLEDIFIELVTEGQS